MSITNKIIDKIKREDIKMKPKLYFVSRFLLYFFLGLLCFLFSLFIISFLFFVIKTTGIMLFPKIGFTGMKILFLSFPWIIILLALFSFLILQKFIKKIPVVHKKPLLYSLLLVLLLLLCFSFFMSKTSLHPRLFEKAKMGQLPLMGPAYREYGLKQPKNSCLGKIIEWNENNFQIETKSGRRIIISTTTETRLDKNLDLYDLVIIIGPKLGDEIKAKVIHRIDRMKQIK